MNLCVFCASSDDIDSDYITAVRRLGQAMAARGHTLIFGGGATGLMGAVVNGASECNGHVIGIAPRFFDKPGILYDRCNEFIFTDTMRERKQMMEEKADAFIMVPGGIGTFEEFFEVLVLKQLDQLIKPIAVFNVKGYYDSFCRMMDNAESQGFMSHWCRSLYGVFSEAGELLDYIEKGGISDEISHHGQA